MRTQRRHQPRCFYLWVFITAIVLAASTFVRAQEDHQTSLFADVAKKVALDPTTYAPAAIAYGATVYDWNSSQPFFRNGFNERNPRFTISGLPNDSPVTYSDGRSRILKDALVNLQTSVINNAVDGIIEHYLIAQHPEHRKLFRALSWIERVSFASYMSYQLSAQHFQQAALNEQRAQELGLR